ncbi:MAG: hypothetical protein OES38_01550 [Gammaproteobacteria bacterium]|nr:hypothetical protein [Gammaproteobacteria bacterium]
MNMVQHLAVAALALSFGSAAFAAEESDVEAAKQAALQACVAEAEKRYGSGEIASKARKKNISAKRGYEFRMKVGKSGKRRNCFSDRDGRTMFYK